MEVENNEYCNDIWPDYAEKVQPSTSLRVTLMAPAYPSKLKWMTMARIFGLIPKRKCSPAS